MPTLSVASGSEVDGPWLVPARAALPLSGGGGRPPPPPSDLGRVREWKLTVADLLDGDEDAIWAVPVALVGRAGTDEASGVAPHVVGNGACSYSPAVNRGATSRCVSPARRARSSRRSCRWACCVDWPRWPRWPELSIGWPEVARGGPRWPEVARGGPRWPERSQDRPEMSRGRPALPQVGLLPGPPARLEFTAKAATDFSSRPLGTREYFGQLPLHVVDVAGSSAPDLAVAAAPSPLLDSPAVRPQATLFRWRRLRCGG